MDCDDGGVLQEPVEDADGGGVLGQDVPPLLEGPVGGDRERAAFVGGDGAAGWYSEADRRASYRNRTFLARAVGDRNVPVGTRTRMDIGGTDRDMHAVGWFRTTSSPRSGRTVLR